MINSYNIKYISVDSGKAHTKYSFFDGNAPGIQNIMAHSFRTTLAHVNPNDLISSENIMYYDGKYYDVGGSDEVALTSSSTKLNRLHELCVYKAIYESLRQMGADLTVTHNIDLSINVPLYDFKTNREAYIKRYKDKSPTLKINNKPVHFIIRNVRLSYEGLGAIIRNTNTSEGSYYVIDIGGKNDTHILFENLRPNKTVNSMTNNGVLELLQLVASDLSVEYEFTIKDVEDIIREKKPKPEMFDDILKKQASKWVRKIKNQVQKYKLNPLYTTLIFSGGGSIILKEMLEAEFSAFVTEFAEQAQFDNVKGALERIAGEL